MKLVPFELTVALRVCVRTESATITLENESNEEVLEAENDYGFMPFVPLKRPLDIELEEDDSFVSETLDALRGSTTSKIGIATSNMLTTNSTNRMGIVDPLSTARK